MPADLLPLQSGVGNVANAVMAGLKDGPFEKFTAYTEVLQDGMFDLIKSGKMTFASATAFSLSPEAAHEFNRDSSSTATDHAAAAGDLQPLRRSSAASACIAMNGLIEADIYGNVNSTHIRGSAS